VLRQSVESAQYLAIPYTGRLDQIGAVTSVGSIGDSYDNAAAESLIGLFKTELIRRSGPRRGLDHVQLATLEWADWFNNRWLYSAYGNVPPVEYEQQHYRHIAALETLETAESSLHRTRGGSIKDPDTVIAKATDPRPRNAQMKSDPEH
jgi:putative transposase